MPLWKVLNWLIPKTVNQAGTVATAWCDKTVCFLSLCFVYCVKSICSAISMFIKIIQQTLNNHHNIHMIDNNTHTSLTNYAVKVTVILKVKYNLRGLIIKGESRGLQEIIMCMKSTERKGKGCHT